MLWEMEKLLVMSNFSFSHRIFKRLVHQTRKNKSLFGKGLKHYLTNKSVFCLQPTEVNLHLIIHYNSLPYQLLHYFWNRSLVLQYAINPFPTMFSNDKAPYTCKRWWIITHMKIHNSINTK